MLSNILRCKQSILKSREYSNHSYQLKAFTQNVIDSILQSPVRQHWEEKLNYEIQNIENSIFKFEETVDKLLVDIDRLAREQFDTYNQISIDLYKTMEHDFIKPRSNFQEPINSEWPTKILNRQMELLPDERQKVIERIQYHASWEYPGMFIRPGLEKFVEHMVPSDPLYLVDHNIGLLLPARTPFPEQYQRRLRMYPIRDSADEIFFILPKNQFSLITIWYFFDFKPQHIVEKYLTEIYNLLRPGGVVAFSLNDCDYPHNVGLVENRFCCFTPGSRVKEHAAKIGYEIFYEYHTPGSLHWFELRKPGELLTLRGGQSLAKIIPIS